jgi:hypothetical protein
MPIAYKEWAVTVRALSEGEQLLTVQKGDPESPDSPPDIEHERFFLFPTFDHQRNDLVRESHHSELDRALEEGVWPDEEPPARALIQDGGISFGVCVWNRNDAALKSSLRDGFFRPYL